MARVRGEEEEAGVRRAEGEGLGGERNMDLRCVSRERVAGRHSFSIGGETRERGW